MVVRLLAEGGPNAVNLLRFPFLGKKSNFLCLTRSSDYANLKNNGRRISKKTIRWLFIVVGRNQENELNRFGWTVSAKVGGAVVRNRLKRMLKAYLMKKGDFPFECRDVNFIFSPMPEIFYKRLSSNEFKIALDELLASVK